VGTQIWFRGDIANAIRAAEAASRSTCEALAPSPDEYMEGYRAGFQAALRGLAVAFGLPGRHEPPPETISLRQQTEGNSWRL